jgi:hypothetical protein
MSNKFYTSFNARLSTSHAKNPVGLGVTQQMRQKKEKRGGRHAYKDHTNTSYELMSRGASMTLKKHHFLLLISTGILA